MEIELNQVGVELFAPDMYEGVVVAFSDILRVLNVEDGELSVVGNALWYTSHITGKTTPVGTQAGVESDTRIEKLGSPR